MNDLWLVVDVRDRSLALLSEPKAGPATGSVFVTAMALTGTGSYFPASFAQRFSLTGSMNASDLPASDIDTSDSGEAFVILF